MRVARVKAQAKVNLFLKVYPWRDSAGYHPLYTAFQRIDLADDVVVRVGGTARSLDVTGPRVPDEGLGPVEKNLAYRAAAAFLEHPSQTMDRGFAIELTKRIPVGGGLGGGSADAGAVLRALNAMSAQPMPPTELGEIAATLGSDVPFLASDNVIAVGTKRGDEVHPGPQPWVMPAPVLVIVPSFGIATKDAYAWLDLDRVPLVRVRPLDARDEPSGPVESRGVVSFPVRPFRGWDTFKELGNDFEPVVEKRHPVLAEYRELLSESGAVFTRLAGSGSSVFGVFDERSWSALDHDSLALRVASTGADVIETRISAQVVEAEVQQ